VGLLTLLHPANTIQACIGQIVGTAIYVVTNSANPLFNTALV